MNEPRYFVVPGSESGHCCFEATVCDRTKPIGQRRDAAVQRYEQVCECFEAEDAELIASALNERHAQERSLQSFFARNAG